LLGLFGGGAILFFLFLEKMSMNIDLIQEHGPLLILGMMLVLFGVQVLAVGLMGELLMRTHFDANPKPVYRVERIVRGSGREFQSQSLDR
jgi:hypothetical protein